MKPRRYTQEEKAFLVAYVPGHSHREIQEAFNGRFSPGLELGQVRSFIKNNRLSTGRDGRFGKGHVPANKGRPMPPGQYEKCEATMFKEGQTPATTDPVGTEKTLSDGYVWVKVDDKPKAPKKDNWKQKHRLLWEKEHGPIPEGHKILFLDGDRTHVELENLALVSNAELARLNRGGLIREDRELTETGIAIVKVLGKIKEAEAKGKENPAKKG